MTEALDCIDDFFDEDLEDGVWSSEAFTIFIALLLKLVILSLLKYFLISEVIVDLWIGTSPQVVLILYNKIDVPRKVLVKAVELR